MNLTNPTTRPATIEEVATRAHSIKDWGLELGDLIDDINIQKKTLEGLASYNAFCREPPLLRDKFSGGEIADAYAAALAVYLSRLAKVLPPSWASGPDRYLDNPWFPLDLSGPQGGPLLARLLVEAPSAFRERNLFIDEESLSRT